MKKYLYLFLCSLITVLHLPSASACTTFSVPDQDQLVVGKSYDWHAGQGVMFLNHRGLAKKALDISGNFSNPAKWTAEHGSLTFSQFGIDLPLGGVNEAGLIVEIMWLSESTYPRTQSLPQLNELQWIQYILDMASTTVEAIQLSREVQVSKFSAAVHYMVCDTNQECASFEYVNRKLKINRQSIPTLTNNTYKSSSNYISNFDGFGGSNSIPTGNGSQARFVRASSIAANLSSGYRSTDFLAMERDAFGILDSVRSRQTSGGFASQWQIVYQPQQDRVSFKLAAIAGMKTLDTSQFDYDCATSQAKVLDLRGDVLTQIPKWTFVDYDQARHHKKIFGSGNISIGSPFPASSFNRIYNDLHSRSCQN